MPGIPRTFDPAPFEAGALARAKGGHRISVCIPARNEAATVGAVVGAVRRSLVAEVGGVDLVDEVLVVDDGSTDGTAQAAGAAGATVVTSGAPHGKGRAMRTGLHHARGDLLVFLDADVTGLDEHFVTRLLGPLLTSEGIALVKGFYRRPYRGDPSGGGRVTELVAKPLLEVLFPDLVGVHQPLAGETAARRHILEEVEFEPGYGVEIGLLVDVARIWGPAAVAQVDLGVRAHRNRPLDELRPQARDVLEAALARRHAPVGARPDPL